MAYKNDHLLTVANKYGLASMVAKGELFETYDRLRDLTVSGTGVGGTGLGTSGGFLWQLARLLSPGAFTTVMGGNASMNIPGTSYWSPLSGGTAQIDGGQSAFGIGNLGNYTGFSSPIMWGFGSSGQTGYATGGASSAFSTASNIASMTNTLDAASYSAGAGSGFGFMNNAVLPLAGIISGWGGIMQACAPYLDAFGLPATVMGNLMQGTSSAALAAYQNVSGNILNSADIILSNKVRNIETVCKMLDTQGDIVRKMLKESLDGDSKALQNL